MMLWYHEGEGYGGTRRFRTLWRGASVEERGSVEMGKGI